MPASGRLGFQTNACARSLPSHPLFCTLNDRSRCDIPYPLTVPSWVLAASLPFPEEYGYGQNPCLLRLPLCFLHKVLMGQVVVVWCLVCAVTFLCLFARFFTISHTVSFFFLQKPLARDGAPSGWSFGPPAAYC